MSSCDGISHDTRQTYKPNQHEIKLEKKHPEYCQVFSPVIANIFLITKCILIMSENVSRQINYIIQFFLSPFSKIGLNIVSNIEDKILVRSVQIRKQNEHATALKHLL